MIGAFLAVALSISVKSASGYVPLQSAGIQTGTLEMRLRIEGKSDAPLRLHFSPYVDRVEARITHRDGSVTTTVAGMTIPYAKRSIPALDPEIPLPLDLPDPATIDITVHAEDLRFAAPSLETNYPDNPSHEPDWFYIATVGLLFGIALYHLVLYAVLRYRNLILYVGYLAAFILYEFTASGLGWRYLWPFASLPAINALRVAAFIVALAVMAFARSFMQTAKHTRTLDRIFVGFVALTGLMTLIGIVMPETLAVVAIVGDVGLLGAILALTITAIVCWIRGVRTARFFLIGFAGLFVGAITKIVVDDIGSISSTAHFYGIELGVSFDAIVIALGLADTVRSEIRQKEIAQAVAAEQEKLARTDALTGVANRRVFDERLIAEWSRTARHSGKIAIIMLDLDRFKSYNDKLGHIAGDECLCAIARSAAGVVHRADEVFARYGGEEFAIILPDTTEASALSVAQHAVAAISKMNIAHPDGGILTMSAGLAVCVANPHVDPETLVADADAALYRAKAAGGNQVSTGSI